MAASQLRRLVQHGDGVFVRGGGLVARQGDGRVRNLAQRVRLEVAEPPKSAESIQVVGRRREIASKDGEVHEAQVQVVPVRRLVLAGPEDFFRELVDLRPIARQQKAISHVARAVALERAIADPPRCRQRGDVHLVGFGAVGLRQALREVDLTRPASRRSAHGARRSRSRSCIGLAPARADRRTHTGTRLSSRRRIGSREARAPRRPSGRARAAPPTPRAGLPTRGRCRAPGSDLPLQGRAGPDRGS